MQYRGTDKSQVGNSAFSTLDNANQRMQQSVQFEAQSAANRSEIAQSSIQSLSNTAQNNARSTMQQVQAESLLETRKIEQKAQSGGGALGQIAQAVGNFAETKIKLDQQDRELDIKEAKVSQELKLAKQKAEREKNFTSAYAELSDYRAQYKSGGGFDEAGGMGIFKSKALDIISKYDLDDENVRALTKEVYGDIQTKVDSNIQKQSELTEKMSHEARGIVQSQLMFKLAGVLGNMKSSDYQTQKDAKERLDMVVGEFIQREDVDDLDRMAIINTVFSKALENYQEGTEEYQAMFTQQTNIREYIGEMTEANQKVLDNQWSKSQRDIYLATRRHDLKIPGSFGDVSPFEDIQSAKEVLAMQADIDRMQEARVVDAAKAQQLSNQSIGYLSWNIIQNPSLINQLKGSSVYSAHPGVQTAIEIAELYNTVETEDVDISLKLAQINEDMAQLNQRGVNWFVSNAQSAKEINVTQLLAQNAGLTLPPGNDTSGLTEDQQQAYIQSQQQIRDALIQKAQVLDAKRQANRAKLAPYSLDLPKSVLKDVMPKRQESYNREMEMFNQVRTQQQQQTPSLGVQTPFKQGATQSQGRRPIRKDKDGYWLNEKGDRVTLNLYQMKGKGDAILPFRPGAPISGVSSHNYLEDRGNKRHAGEDIGAPAGTELVFYMPGTVLKTPVHKGKGYGQYIDILGDDGMVHRFGHLQQGSVTVRPGQRVDAGQMLGRTGDSGSPDSFHLHWEVRKNYQQGAKEFGSNDTVNPFDYMAGVNKNPSQIKRPVGNKQGWQADGYEPGQSFPRVPKGALDLGGGVYVLNGKIGQLKNFTSESDATQSFNTGKPIRMGGESNNSKTYINKPDANHGYAVIAQDKSFLREMNSVATRLGIPAQWLADVMAFETGGTFSAALPGSKTMSGDTPRGLIQFIPETARRLGTSPEALSKMSRTQQLKYVEKYLGSPEFKKHLNKGAEYVLAAVWGGGGLVNRMARGEDVSNVSDGYITFKEYMNKLGKHAGRKYNTRYNRRDRLKATTHTGENPDCKVCQQLVASGSGIIPHESQMS